MPNQAEVALVILMLVLAVVAVVGHLLLGVLEWGQRLRPRHQSRIGIGAPGALRTQLQACGGFTLTRCRSPSIAQRRPDDQINDDVRPALLALALKKGQRCLDLSNPAGGHRDQ
jgi:hypothetical protein